LVILSRLLFVLYIICEVTVSRI